MTHILVVEDEESFVEALRVGLKREGFFVEIAKDGVEALQRFERQKPDLVLLDVMLPKMSGIDVCRALRLISTVPIIMVTAKSEEIDTVVGLEVGADDYVAKPFRLRELVARIRAVLRRTEQTNVGKRVETQVLRVADITLDRERHEVTIAGNVIEVPRKEFEILALLMQNFENVVSRQRFISEVWGSDYVGDTKTLDVHIKRLRARIEDEPLFAKRIVTVRGVGYKLVS